jgi:hypothetical protein
MNVANLKMNLKNMVILLQRAIIKRSIAYAILLFIDMVTGLKPQSPGYYDFTFFNFLLGSSTVNIPPTPIQE